MKEVGLERLSFIKCPMKSVLVVSASRDGKPNAMPANWHMCTSKQPPLYAVSIGKTRYTHQLIKESKEFVVSFPSIEMAEAVGFCGSVSGKNTDKFKETKMKTFMGKSVKVPLLEEASANIECKLVQEIETGDHTIFIGEVKAVWENPKKEALFDLAKGNFSAMKPKN